MSWAKILGGALAAVAVLILLDKSGSLRTPVRPPPKALPKVAAAPPAAGPAGYRPGDETPDVLPDGPGRDETFYVCTGCHGTALVRAQGMRRDQWDDSISWMIEKHNMVPPDAATRSLLLDYLATAFPPRQEERRGWNNPFAGRQ